MINNELSYSKILLYINKSLASGDWGIQILTVFPKCIDLDILNSHVFIYMKKSNLVITLMCDRISESYL